MLELNAAQICEGLMMLTFGISWPMQIIKTIRTKNPMGKSFLFLYLILMGYLAGLASQAFEGRLFKPETILYVINTLMVLTDLVLSTYYLMRLKRQQKQS